ncbi:hypothetical protein P691DRAFT_784791 [Macrolepiota fuliginosa MF-IS2]|uniref:Uncharacterized protein n=1 Tax=Macrolepiota fuliginosa MF-IS2 TaxID=1400762 RepID=A0A9P6C1L5_9AGAR|nr:hypothetical protein P691DRAFT_784791 [Macrolepiota fuliginosa MF-IS2]
MSPSNETVIKFSVDKGSFRRFLQWLCSLGSICNDPLVTVIQEDPREQVPMLKGIQVGYHTHFPHEYIASFIPDVDPPELPFTLKLQLGKVAHIYISLEVGTGWREGYQPKYTHLIGQASSRSHEYRAGYQPIYTHRIF